MKIETLRCGDNFIYLLLEGARAAVVDPGAAKPVFDALQLHGAALELILITHHHGDHTGGCAALKRATGCRIVGPGGGSILPDETVSDNGLLTFAGASISVLAVPGHTAHDVAYTIPAAKALFTGDTLFAGGCGRLFNGDFQTMWTSLCRLRALPKETRIYGGHDYTRDNLEFALHLEPQNAAILQRLSQCIAQEAAGGAPSPSTVAEECLTNPFLRCDLPVMMQAANLPDAAPEDVFAEIRQRKDHW